MMVVFIFYVKESTVSNNLGWQILSRNNFEVQQLYPII